MRAICVLPLEKMFFIKKISLEDTISGEVVCYARNLSEEYRMNPDKAARENHLYLGYSEKDFPCDELDKKILEEIQRKFPNAQPHTSLMMLNADMENNQMWLSQHARKDLNIVIEFVSPLGPIRRVHNNKPKIEIYYPRVMHEHHGRMNTNINILVNNNNEYQRLCSLLDSSYKIMSDIVENN